MSFDLVAIIDELATQLETIELDGDQPLKVHRFGPDAKRLEIVPCAIVALPTAPVRYLETSGGPAAATTIPVVVAVSRVHSRSAHRLLAEFMSSHGPRSIRACIDAGDFDTVSDPTVLEGVPDEMTLAADTYLVAIFDVQVME